LQAAAVEPECAGSTVCDSKIHCMVTGVVMLSHCFHLDSSWYRVCAPARDI